MKFLTILSFVLVAAFAVPAWAAPADHPANPEARVPAFRPGDFFSAAPQLLAAAQPESTGHEHGARAGGDEAAAAEDSKSCKRGEGCCCCCKCCDKDKEEKRESKSDAMQGCDMMQKMMGKDKDAAKPAGKDDEHASHH